MPKADDPYYNRKAVPASLIQDVGLTGLSRQEEFANRERKYSGVDGGDLRKFSNKLEPQSDPYYGRRRVSKHETDGVGDSGMTEEQEHDNRERKYSVNGVDVRRFGSTSSGGFKPTDDPYYGRKAVNSKLTKGIGETGNTPAQDFEVRERKQSVVNFSGDPFQQLVGQGHRQSVSGGQALDAANQATERRRSSAVGPGASAAAAKATHRSGYDGDKLAPIMSKPELPPVANVSEDRDEITSEGSTFASSNMSGSGTTGVASGASGPGSAAPGANGHATYYDATTTGHGHAGAHQDLTSTTGHSHAGASQDLPTTTEHSHARAPQVFDDPDSVAPDEMR